MLKGLSLFTRHLQGKGFAISLLFLLGIAGAASSLATPLIGKSFIDRVVGKGEFSLLPWLAAILLSLAVADLMLGCCTRLVHARLSAAVLVEIRERLFDRCLTAPLSDLERFRHGDLLNRFGADISKIQALLVDGVLGFVQNVLFLAVAAAILLKLSAALALWSFVGLAAALVITASFRKPVENGTRVVREAMVDLSHFLSERLGALRAIRFHGAQESERSAFSGHNAEVVRRMLRFQTLDAAASGLPAVALAASLAWIYLLGGRLIETGAISAGTFVAFVLYQGRLTAPAVGLLGLVRNLQEARISLERVAEVLAGETAAGTGAPSLGAGGIGCEGIRFAYAEGAQVLNGVDLRVAPGERAALFGSSGSGKSTLIQILFGLRAASGGWVTVGRNAAGEGFTAKTGYAGAEPFLMHASVAMNIRYGNPDRTDAEIREAARIAEADRFIADLPEGYETVIGGRGTALSDGQRQRIGLARLILQDPGILVLDEAFSAMDPETEAKVRRNLFRRFTGRTFLVVSHRLDGLEDFDTLYLMEQGKVRQVGREELLAALGGNASTPRHPGERARRATSFPLVPKLQLGNAIPR